MKKKLPLSIPEIVIYSLCALMAIWALTYIALGISVSFLRYDAPLVVTDNGLKGGTAGLGFLYQGFIILAVAVVVSVVTLLLTAKKNDRDFEKAQRRAARLAKVNNRPEPQVVDVEAQEKPAE